MKTFEKVAVKVSHVYVKWKLTRNFSSSTAVNEEVYVKLQT